MKYARSFFVVRPYNNTSSKMVFDATFFSPRSLANASNSTCSFIIIATNVGAEFSYPIGTTFHHQFLSRLKNASIYSASYSATTCQYSLSMYTEIK